MWVWLSNFSEIPIFDIIILYQSLWLLFWSLKKTRNPIVLLERARFPSHTVLEIYTGNRVCNGNLLRNCLHTMYEQEKRILRAAIYVIWCIFSYTPVDVIVLGLLHLQMRISFPFLRPKDLRTSLLIMRTCSFLLYCS